MVNLMLNIVIPMAGLGSRFVDAGYKKPKPFIDVLGKPMIERVLENLSCPNSRYILIAREEHIKNESVIVSEIEKKYNAVFVPVKDLTEGTVCTTLFARKYINTSDPLIIANSDQLVDICLSDYLIDAINRKLDGSILSFIEENKDPKWSYAKIDNKGYVTQVKEKSAISEYATVGIYFFHKGSDFVDASIDMIVRNDRVNNEFYTCPAYNYMIDNDKKVGLFNINKQNMHGLGTPEDLDKYIEFYKNNPKV